MPNTPQRSPRAQDNASVGDKRPSSPSAQARAKRTHVGIGGLSDDELRAGALMYFKHCCERLGKVEAQRIWREIMGDYGQGKPSYSDGRAHAPDRASPRWGAHQRPRPWGKATCMHAYASTVYYEDSA
jgi:hypothetical protein